MQVVILAGGLAKRLGLLCKEIPKAMMKFNGRPFIDYKLKWFAKNGFSEVVLCLGHFYEVVVDYLTRYPPRGVDIKFSIEDRILGTGGALIHTLPYLNETFCVSYGDSFLFVDFVNVYKTFQDKPGRAMMVVTQKGEQRHQRNVNINDGYVSYYTKNLQYGVSYIDYGFIVMKRDILEEINIDGTFDLEEIFTYLISRRELMAYETEKPFLEIGSYKGICEFKEYIYSIQSGKVDI